MHTAALAELGLSPEWTYEAIEVAPDGFEGLIRTLQEEGFAGVNVTVPHKLAALALADEAGPAARATGAANTLSFRDGRIEAENTDAVGIIAALPRPPHGARALVLGAGGSARAATWALREAGAEVSVWNRTAQRARALAREFAVIHTEAPATAEYDLILNATTIGMAGSGNPRAEGQPPGDRGLLVLKPLPIDADALNMSQTVVDLAYASEKTALIAAAGLAGATTVDGLEVLVQQGAASLELWTHRPAPIAAMRAAARGT